MSTRIEPHSLESLKDCLRTLQEDRTPAAIRGGETHGDTPAKERAIVSLRRLTGIVSYAPEDLTITVRSGTPFTELQTLLGERGQWLPVEPAVDSSSTIGGVVATGLVGPSQNRYGPLRDHLIAARYVVPGGDDAKSGSHVVKSVAGYDVHKLLVGSRGTLCAIAELTFKVSPKYEKRTVVKAAWNAASGPVVASNVGSASAAASLVLSRPLARTSGLGDAAIWCAAFDGYAAEVVAATMQFCAQTNTSPSDEITENDLYHCIRQWNFKRTGTVAIAGSSQTLISIFERLTDSCDAMLDLGAGVLTVDATQAALDFLSKDSAAQSAAFVYGLKRVPWSSSISSAERKLASRLKNMFDPRGILEQWEIYQ